MPYVEPTSLGQKMQVEDPVSEIAKQIAQDAQAKADDNAAKIESLKYTLANTPTNAALGNLSNLQTEDKTTFVNSLNENVNKIASAQKTIDVHAERLAGQPLDLNSFKRIDTETDDSGLLQRAIEQAKLTSQSIFLSAKTYKFSQTINLYNGVKLIGQNKYSTLQYTGNGIAFNCIDTSNTQTSYGYGCYYNVFSNFTLIGNGTGSGTTAFKGELRYSVFSNVTIRSFGTFFDMNNNWTNRFTSCTFQYADIWYKANSQNNAVNFVNCSFDTARIGFQMTSCYAMSFIGGTIEKCSSAIMSPSVSGGAYWSNLSFDCIYFENPAPLVSTDVMAGDGKAITSWEVRDFSLARSNINFFVSGQPWIKTNVSNIINGSIESCMFYKNDDSVLFDMLSSPLLFCMNQYRYFNGGAKTDITSPFSTQMESFNTSYMRVDLKYPNSLVYSGALNVNKGIVVGQTSDNNLIDRPGHLLYLASRGLIRVSTGTGTYYYLQPTISGTTAQRPALSSFQTGYQYFDTTLGKPIWYNGTVWKDATGTTV